MPTRLIREGILTSDKVAALSWEAEVFFRRLMSVVDDYGLHDARPAILRSALFPLQLDKMSECNIQRCLTACEASGLILLYSRSGKPYLMIRRFGQTPRTAPKCPLPEGYTVTATGKGKYELHQPEKEAPNENSCEQLKTTENNCEQLCTYAYPNADAENMGIGNMRAGAQERPVEQMPADPEEVRRFMAAQIEHPVGDALEATARDFFDTFEARGWRDSRGIPLHDWRAAARQYARTAARNAAEKQTQNNPNRPKTADDYRL